ncbi:hypothetical protein SDC9_207682 [bioreactor metagenome]|uniref:Uncharacterized protein n=1 Tax=bioreactor metagenome TaxID=1076179 RepID=A0A645JB48_9ZZZZ
MVVYLIRPAALLHHAPVDQEDPVAHRHRFRLVMGHVDDGDAQTLLYLLDLKAHGLTQLGVKV